MVPDTLIRVATAVSAVFMKDGVYCILRTAKAAEIRSVPFAAEEH
jgi:hypothetical protein